MRQPCICQRELAATGVMTTRLARGLPTGGDLEYVDSVTLMRALEDAASYVDRNTETELGEGVTTDGWLQVKEGREAGFGHARCCKGGRSVIRSQGSFPGGLDEAIAS